MANTFKSYGSAITSGGYTTIYTAPSATQTTIIGFSLANTYTTSITVNVQVVKGASSYYLAYQVPVPVGSSIVIVGGDQKVVLEAANYIRAQVVTTSGTADAVVSLLEIT